MTPGEVQWLEPRRRVLVEAASTGSQYGAERDPGGVSGSSHQRHPVRLSVTAAVVSRQPHQAGTGRGGEGSEEKSLKGEKKAFVWQDEGKEGT